MAGKTIHQFSNPRIIGLVSVQPLRVPVENFTHACEPSVSVSEACRMVGEIHSRSLLEFSKRCPCPFDKYNPSHGELMGGIMRSDPQMKEVFNLLSLDYNDLGKIYLPWWNEEAGREIRTECAPGRARAILGSRHSYQTQLLRSGAPAPGIAGVSVAGIVMPSDGSIAIGLRSGLSYANTFHLCAGALKATAGLKDGAESVYDIFAGHELLPEFGISQSDVADASLLSKTVAYGGDRDTSFVFLVRLKLGAEETIARFSQNTHEAKGEHSTVVLVPGSASGIGGFVKSFYRGAAEDNPDRKFAERALLPQCAGPLVDYAGLPFRMLEKLVLKKNQWA